MKNNVKRAAFCILFSLLCTRAHAQDVSMSASSGDDAARDERIERLEARLRELEAVLAAHPPTLQPPASETVPDSHEQEAAPLAYADFSWVPGNRGSSEKPLSYGPFTGEIRIDTAYHYSFANPVDNTISGSSEVFRHGELQVTQIGVGGDFNYKGFIARFMTQFGMYSQTTPRNDASAARGQWNLDDAYRYISEAYGGFHVDALKGINVEAGIFMSYIGLWSYYNYDNWTYQPSYVSSNTPWFFTGARVQVFTSDKLKIEPWLINGWQSYGQFNRAYGFGGQVQWRPMPWLSAVFNNYVGQDTLGVEGRWRVHTDDSVSVQVHRDASSPLSRAAVSLTVDAGCEWGGEVECSSQYFVGFMAYARMWFWNDRIALTAGGGAISNPGRYLVLVPPINGATAYSGTPYFTAAPGDKFRAWDMQIAADYAINPFVTLRLEYNHRAANVPYFSGHGGVTPPGGNQGAPGSMVDGWAPDLSNTEDRLTAAMMVRL